MSMPASVWTMNGAAAHVAVGAVELLPEVLDARRVLAVEQLEQRLRQRLRHARIERLVRGVALVVSRGVALS